MPPNVRDELKLMCHSDMQRFANYLGSRLRTIAKVYHTRVFASPEQKIQLYNTWEQELVGYHLFLFLYGYLAPVKTWQ